MKKIKDKMKCIMAYFYMPFLFIIIGYGLIYITVLPGVKLLKASVVLIMAENAPDYNFEMKSIYKAEIKQNNPMAAGAAGQPSDETACLNISSKEENVEKTVDVKEIQFPELGSHYAMISCERIQLEVPVYWGDTEEILSSGIGQYMGSFLPGFDRGILLSGHNTTFFSPLEIIESGDIILYSTNYGEYRYRVDEVFVIREKKAEIMLEKTLSQPEEKLIMYTCYPFDLISGNSKERLFVYASKISGPRVEW